MLWAAIRKDTQIVVRDRGTLLSLFALPLVFVIVFGNLFGSGASEGRAPQTIAVYLEAPNAAGALVFDRLESSGLFAPQRVDSAESMERWVAADSSRVALRLPAGLGPGGDAPAVLLLDQATPMRFRGPIEASVREILRSVRDPQSAATLLQVKTPAGVKPPLEEPSGFQVAVPGNAVLFGFFLALTMALSFVEERTCGTWKRLQAAPVHRALLVVAKLVPFYLIGLVQMGFLFGVGAAAFGMQVAGSLAGLVVLTLALVFAAVALGLFIASFGGNEKQVGSIGSIALLVMGLLGGAMIPRMTMPETMQSLGLATPHGWALEGYNTILLRQGAGLADIAVPCVAVVAFGILFAVVGALRLR